MFWIVGLNHLYDFDDVTVDIYQMEHQYKQQVGNQNRVITEKKYKQNVNRRKEILLDLVVIHYQYLHKYNHQAVVWHEKLE